MAHASANIIANFSFSFSPDPRVSSEAETRSRIATNKSDSLADIPQLRSESTSLPATRHTTRRGPHGQSERDESEAEEQKGARSRQQLQGCATAKAQRAAALLKRPF